MTKEKALADFYGGFQIPAYEENTVPDDAPFPYITYNVATDSIGANISLYCNLWYRSSSWVACNQKARDIYSVVGSGGIILPCDDGGIWLKADSPFAQNLSDPDDDLIRRKYIRLTAEFITN